MYEVEIRGEIIIIISEIFISEGDGRLGFEEGGPYDAIHVGAASPSIPDALLDQLKSPGRMIIPVGTHNQVLLQITKDENGGEWCK